MLQPRLSPGALVIADLSSDDPDQVTYVERMHAPDSGYVTVDIPLDAGVVVSAWLGGSAVRLAAERCRGAPRGPCTSGSQPSSRLALVVSMIAGWLAASTHSAAGGANEGSGIDGGRASGGLARCRRAR